MVGSTLPLPISKVVPFECIVPSVALDIDSPLPKVMSFPVTVKSPLKDVVVAVIATVPSVELEIVSESVSYTHLTLPTILLV